MIQQRVVFNNKVLPYLLIAPQVIITLVFFFWPASQALYQSVLQEDPFGLASTFVGLDNFIDIFTDEIYLNSLLTTGFFSISVTFSSMIVSLLLAVMANRVLWGGAIYKTLLIWPYAVATMIAGVLWFFLFNSTAGIIAYFLRVMEYDWNHALNTGQAMFLVIFASAWRQISYNFIFFLAGLHSIPPSLIEASAIDGASPFKRFWTIVFPLLSPTSFFLIVVNVVYSFFETFGVVHAITGGGPDYATNILVFKVYHDGVLGLDIGSSAAQSVILMSIVIFLTVIQFRYIERKVHY
ncbi:MAG: sn-glycerol-3-phosphate ABC transporter permease UgpA [Deltaproteobacteria bacterium]|mgnify:CR=1 FL=1|jgi:sn-glycerol 3-phosphate transport system permease protein|nr:sn-glycerol-3-phosphate ABC transporter permease UgpA [Deltaproteobacteria bacterium]MBT4264938.1 sn-glycerol-3-phosphate ABC transporter permease UgpA [Deltaproteobacteria bacterium]MBT4640398.1 sn-glycerol-3-phosphate ABC transporter permease UgpA [Deltaproteobacteria bacterium]MBT6501396.1 sn-glycerol-3-phosphate ABC transporter permease UgpA [Deltaproteobacteria bacterium]MBT6615924.1 sn-glycerol-3-phosphate ABC transporter permease UgpA [Deltaproteobacteria bacterium]